MKSRRTAAAGILLGALALGAAAATVIPEGRLIKVVLDTPVSTKTNKAGDAFTLHCEGDDCGGFPAETRFRGTLVAVRHKTAKLPGSIDVTITRAELPGGTMVDISALPATEKGEVRPTFGGHTIKEKRQKMGKKIGIAGSLILGPLGSVAGAAASKKAPQKPDDISAKPGKKGYIKIMHPVTLK
jgi:hypothetical protein